MAFPRSRSDVLFGLGRGNGSPLRHASRSCAAWVDAAGIGVTGAAGIEPAIGVIGAAGVEPATIGVAGATWVEPATFEAGRRTAPTLDGTGNRIDAL